MCGISGVITRKGITDELAQAVTRMDCAQIHRGPDGAGRFAGEQVHLAARRLSIVDHANGAQPLFNEDRTLALVANGEIYNHIELRPELEARGHRFATGSDCECILHLYEEHGAACVERLRGMFAFALWDVKRARLMLARDRMGEKPLYLFEQNRTLLFASELRALLASRLVPRRLNPEAVDLYFHYQYVPEPLTPVEGVRKLDAAHVLTIDAATWTKTEKCYWRMEDSPPLAGDAAEPIRERFEEAVALTLRADTPVGIALSGGIDSGAIAAVAAREARRTNQTLHAFSVGYEGRPPSDERSEAQALAANLGIEFHEVEIETNQIVEFFPELVGWQDDPVADIAGYGYHSVMRAARRHGVPVMLQGQGGDELFWGYEVLRQAALESCEVLDVEASNSSAFARHAGYLRPRLPAAFNRTSLSAWARGGAGLLANLQRRQRYQQAKLSQRPIFYELAPDFMSAVNGMHEFYQGSFSERVAGLDPTRVWSQVAATADVDVRLTRLICDTYLRGNGIAQGDRLAMASSIELRLPFVDHKFVETVIGLRKTRTDVMLEGKAWLKQAVRGYLPSALLDRPKRGFAPPINVWHKALFARYGASLIEGRLVEAGVLSSPGARRLARGEFPADATAPLSFKALVLEQWCRNVL